MPRLDGLTVSDLRVTTAGKEILSGVNLTVPPGEVHALMGPNGSGKSTLAHTLMGHPAYTVTSGSINFNGEDITHMRADQRACLGIFLSFQYPIAVPGVTVVNFMRAAMRSQGKELPAREFMTTLSAEMEKLKIEPSFRSRYLNDGFSGGEKKRCEILQMAMLKPKLAILDETDSGLDVDALRTVADGVSKLRNPAMGVLVITHYYRILEQLQPDFVHILHAGKIVASGNAELAQTVEKAGYEPILGPQATTPEALPV